ncbi:acetylglutamate kinase [candidate division BRC1 bacterium HGW-BRC1-1]|jgi:acetylglutamate kinase|nr:MAG: acetylglutamate kinase [candidate division BRC1 bacterium HGW-BRC1-1]
MTDSIDLRKLPIERLIERAQILVEALPYIRQFHDSTIVIKFGGAAQVQPELKNKIIQDIALMAIVGMKPVVVHGGGPEVSRLMKKMGHEPRFIAGQRVTDADALDMAEMVLAGKVNSEITLALNRAGVNAVGLSGKDMNLIRAVKLFHQESADGEKTDIGFVGDVLNIDTSIINILDKNGIVPVISPIGVDEDGQRYNINADTVACDIAASLKADKLILLTDVKGILRDRNDEGSLINSIKADEIEKLISEGIIQGGMIPKTRAAVDALKSGVKKTHILDGRLPHSLLLEIFTDRGIGTQIIP